MNHLTRNNIILLVCLVGLLVLYPVLRSTGALIRDLLQTAIFFSGVFALDFSTKSLKVLLPLGAITAATTWIEFFLHHRVTFLIDSITTFLFLVAIVVLMIRHIARSRRVTPTIILSSINGYLLLGFLGAALLAVAESVDRAYFAAPSAGAALAAHHTREFFDYLYFSYVTLTTLGYGDVTPLSYVSRSTAILLAITGQLYMTILVAMLVGKFLASEAGD